MRVADPEMMLDGFGSIPDITEAEGAVLIDDSVSPDPRRSVKSKVRILDSLAYFGGRGTAWIVGRYVNIIGKDLSVLQPKVWEGKWQPKVWEEKWQPKVWEGKWQPKVWEEKWQPKVWEEKWQPSFLP